MKSAFAAILMFSFWTFALPAEAISPVYPKQDKKTAKLRSALQRLGSGDVRVEVVLKDGQSFSGKLQNVNTNGFLLDDHQRGTINVSFDHVTSIKANNLSTGTWVWIGVGVAAWMLAICRLGSGGFCHS